MVSRRRFLHQGAGVGAGWTLGTLPALAAVSRPWHEASITELQAAMAVGATTSRELTQVHLTRIAQLNPLLNAVIESNPQALQLAAQLDAERAAGRVRGPLHGIPILLKDNVATADAMRTTAGSLALLQSRPLADAPVAASLRAAGAVLLGKANLSEWANFRGFTPLDASGSFFLNGWSARGGFTRNAYQLGWDSSGSSAGSAVGTAAGLCTAAVGTETDGSIVSPAGNNLIVGLKPSMGLLPQAGIVPISHSQDTAGPMARNVTDAALLLAAMGASADPLAYVRGLRRGALAGARIGIDSNLFYTYTDPAQAAVAWLAVQRTIALGAQVVYVDVGDPLATFYDAEFTVLLHEFKIDVARYLAGATRTDMRSLADLIDFNSKHCQQEMRYYGQELFEIAQETSGDPNDPGYLAARAQCLLQARDQGLKAAFQSFQLDALAIPTAGWSSSHAAVAGYPNLSLPVGFDAANRPVGLCLVGDWRAEARLLALGYDLEQELRVWRAPSFLGSPYPWDGAALCNGGSTRGALRSGLGGRKGPRRI